MKDKNVTKAQKVFGKDFDNQRIITKCEYPAHLVESEKERYFRNYRYALRVQQKLIKRLLH